MVHVRGDSLRDFYAKGLALVGLGMLAGAGAVVDYWPATLDVPRVARTPQINQPAPVRPPRASGLDPSFMRASLPVAPVSRSDHSSQSFTTQPAGTGATPLALQGANTGTEPVMRSFVAEGAMPLTSGRRIALAAAPVVPAMPMPSTEPAAVENGPVEPPAPRETPAAAAMLASTAPPPDGFFSGALKKTGASIMKGGAATGASIADAFRSVFGAFKKVSPFSPDAQLARPGL